MGDECEYCGREVVAERQNDNNGRMEKLCEQCMADFVRGDELRRREEDRSCPYED